MRINGPRGLRFGVFEVDLESQELRKHGIHIKLPPQPYQALVLLLGHRNEIVTREQLRQTLWPNEAWGDHDLRLNKVMNKIREALGDSIQAPHFLETVPRVGYRFLASVEQVAAAEGGAEESVTLPEPQPERDYRPMTIAQFSRPSPWSRSRIAMVAIGAFFLGGGLTAIIGNPKTGRVHPANPYRATPLTTYPGVATSPSFSPDGKRLVFTLNQGEQGQAQIFVVGSDGSGSKRFTTNPYDDRDPVWSPDGSQIAFLRQFPDRRVEIWTIQADGGSERKVVEYGTAIIGEHPLSWTRNSSFLVAAMRMPVDDPSALFLISVRTGEYRRLTSPDVSYDGDWNPAVSPDGLKLAFTRCGPGSRNLFYIPLSADLAPAGAPVRLTNLSLLSNTVAWSPDGHDLVFSAVPEAYAIRRLFKIGAASLTTTLESAELGIEGTAPVVSPDGKTLVYVRENIHETSIFRAQPSLDGVAVRRTSLVSSTRQDFCPDPSPDGKQLAFSSVRSGSLEIWIANVDGSGARRVTSSGGVTPKWSPGGSKIVYVSGIAGHQDVYVLNPASGSNIRLTSEMPRNILPAWSRDGRHVYFASNRTGTWQIFKTPGTGGVATQITRGGGFYSVESLDGTELYYTSRDGPADVRRVPVSGGEESALMERATSGFSALAIGQGGLYYFSSVTPVKARMDFYSFAARQSSAVLTTELPVDPVFSSSPSGDAVFYSQTDRWDCDLMRTPYRQ